MDFETLPATAGAGGATTSPGLKTRGFRPPEPTHLGDCMTPPTYEQLLNTLFHRTGVIRQIRQYCADKPELLEISKLTGQAFTMGPDEQQMIDIFNQIEAKSTPTPDVMP